MFFPISIYYQQEKYLKIILELILLIYTPKTEFEKSLNKLDCGEVTLEFTARAILNEAFKTPEIIKLFMSKRSDGLRQKLQEITRDNTIGKLGTFSLQLFKFQILHSN